MNLQSLCYLDTAESRSISPENFTGEKGKGRYVGTYMAWGVNNSGWWGEGEIKFYLDGDKDFPTLCGTGTEDYFCGSYNFVSSVAFWYQTLPGNEFPELPKRDYLEIV